MNELIQQIEANRIALNINRRKLCALCDISTEYYSKIIAGEATGVSYSILERLANTLYIRLSFNISPAIVNKLIIK